MHVYERLARDYAHRRHLPNGRHTVYVHYLAPFYTRLTGCFVKAQVAKDSSTRWITLKPSSADSDHYVRVMIRQNRDGSANVISGSGDLRGLKLTRLRSPEQLAADRKEKAQQKRQEAKEEKKRKAEQEQEDLRRSAEDADFAQKRAQEKLEAEELEKNKQETIGKINEELLNKRLEQAQLAQQLGLPGWESVGEREIFDTAALKQERAEAAAAALGVDPSDDPALKAALKGGAGMVTARQTRKINDGLKRLEKQLLQELAENAELRESVLGDQAVAADEVLKTKPSGGLGFQKNLAEQARERGVSVGDIKAEKKRLAEERLDTLSEIGGKKADAALVEKSAEVMQKMHTVAAVLSEVGMGSGPKLETKLNPAEAAKKAEQIKEFLRLAAEAKQLERQAREYRGDTEEIASVIQNRDPATFRVEVDEISDSELIAQLERDVAEMQKRDLTKAFLDEVETGDPGRQLSYGAISHGGYSALNAAVLTVLGENGMDRQVVDVLGMDAAAKLAAYRLAQSLSPEELQNVRDGLKTYHERESLAAMQEALTNAQELRGAAMNMELPDITDSVSLVAAKEMNSARKAYLEEAMQGLGHTLGMVEAGAALNLALGRPSSQLGIDFSGNDIERVLTGLAALGLDKETGDYDSRRDPETGALQVVLSKQGMDKLTPPPDPGEVALRAELEAIRNGELDEEDYLPAGFSSYPVNVHNDPDLDDPTAFAAPPGFGQGQSVTDALGEYVGSRVADGWKPSDILRSMADLDFIDRFVPDAQQGEFFAALNDLFPPQNADGSGRDVDTDTEIAARLDGLARDYISQHHSGDLDFHRQQVDIDAKETRRAAFLAVAKDPRLLVAYKQPSALSNDDRAAIRDYYLADIAKLDAGKGEGKEKVQAALEKLGPEPEKMAQTLFGDEQITDEWRAWTQARAETMEQFGGAAEWGGFVQAMGGVKGAYNAVQEHMRGRFNAEFSRYHGNLTGQSLRQGFASLTNSETLMQAVDPAARKAMLQQRQEAAAGVRERVQGRFAAEGQGSVVAKLQAQQEQRKLQQQSSFALFAPPPKDTRFAGHLVEVAGQRREMTSELEERVSLGRTLEGQLASLLPVFEGGVRSKGGAVNIYGGVTMGKGSKFVKQQRAVKFAVAAGKSVMALGMGCVDGSTMLEDALTGESRAFEEWHESQRAPFVRALDEATGQFVTARASPVFIKGVDTMFDVTLDSGKSIKVTSGHRFLTPQGWRRLGDLKIGSEIAACGEGDMPATTQPVCEQTPANAFGRAASQPVLHSPLSSLRDTRGRPKLSDSSLAFAEPPPHAFRGSRPSVTPRQLSRASLPIPSGHGWRDQSRQCAPFLQETRATVPHPLLCAPAPHLSSLASSQEASCLNVRGYRRIAQGFRRGYHPHHRSCGEQPHHARGSALASAPSRADAHAHTHPSLRGGDPGNESAHTPFYQLCVPPATGDSSLQVVSRGHDLQAGPAFYGAVQSSPKPRQAAVQSHHHSNPWHRGRVPACLLLWCAESWTRVLALIASLLRKTATRSTCEQCRYPSAPQRAATLFRQRSRLSPLGWDTIQSIIPIGQHLVYDITVPHYHNYVAHGLIHHNSGKSNIAIGIYTTLHGEGKARSGLIVCPSVVRSQFGEEMARFTEPGRYKWHAQDDSFENRLAAYQDENRNLVVVTHQTFRQDALRIMANHQGVDEATMQQRFESQSPQERRAGLTAAFDANNMGHRLDYVAVDEGHTLLNRDGKPDSFMAMVGDAAIQEAKYGQLASGTPVKNDSSEIHSLLEKIDPDKYQGNGDAFKRRYGVDMKTAQDAFRREASRYVYAASVSSGVKRTEVWGTRGEDGQDTPLQLSPGQQRALDEVNTAYESARQAQRMGQVNVDAMRTLSPNAFTNQPESQHEAIAGRLQGSLGTLRFAAQGRVIDTHPGAENAKVQRVLQLAEQKRAEGKAGVVFAHSLAAVENLKQTLESQGYRVDTVTGADSSDDKARKRRRFNPDSGDAETDILILSDAGATGMNLQRGEFLINYDLPMTHAVHAQRNARIDRIGQKNDVEVHNLVTDSKYDRDAVRRLSAKENLQNIFEENWEGLDDSGLAKHIAMARYARTMPQAA